MMLLLLSRQSITQNSQLLAFETISYFLFFKQLVTLLDLKFVD